MTCTCGYDLLHPTGKPGDRAECITCGWAAGGPFADHAAHHHYLDTRHTWVLHMEEW